MSDDLVERLRDCETSLSVYDEGRDSEYWLKYPDRIEALEAAQPIVSDFEDKFADLCNEYGVPFSVTSDPALNQVIAALSKDKP